MAKISRTVLCISGRGEKASFFWTFSKGGIDPGTLLDIVFPQKLGQGNCLMYLENTSYGLKHVQKGLKYA